MTTTFWKASVYNLEAQQQQTFIVQSPYDENRTLDLLAEVHPEYETISLTKIDKPDWINNEWSKSPK